MKVSHWPGYARGPSMTSKNLRPIYVFLPLEVRISIVLNHYWVLPKRGHINPEDPFPLYALRTKQERRVLTPWGQCTFYGEYRILVYNRGQIYQNVPFGMLHYKLAKGLAVLHFSSSSTKLHKYVKLKTHLRQLKLNINRMITGCTNPSVKSQDVHSSFDWITHHHSGSNTHGHKLLEKQLSRVRQTNTGHLRLVFTTSTFKGVIA